MAGCKVNVAVLTIYKPRLSQPRLSSNLIHSMIIIKTDEICVSTLSGYGVDSSTPKRPWTPSNTTALVLVYISDLTLHMLQASMTFFVPVLKKYKMMWVCWQTSEKHGENVTILTLDVDLIMKLKVVVALIRRSSVENSMYPFQSCSA
jgi:hypothetical protein